MYVCTKLLVNEIFVRERPPVEDLDKIRRVAMTYTEFSLLFRFKNGSLCG